ncbi:uncharacterized protein LOC134821914 [Bolinopsis microptera]|uniref:uncharacterized protein LOC134821914 n=1 Tax=Bolinopsis microptera TaxID=2820187 RepID=UPI00307A2391
MSRPKALLTNALSDRIERQKVAHFIANCTNGQSCTCLVCLVQIPKVTGWGQLESEVEEMLIANRDIEFPELCGPISAHGLKQQELWSEVVSKLPNNFDEWAPTKVNARKTENDETSDSESSSSKTINTNRRQSQKKFCWRKTIKRTHNRKYHRKSSFTKDDKQCDGKVEHVQESMLIKIDTHNRFEVLNQGAAFLNQGAAFPTEEEKKNKERTARRGQQCLNTVNMRGGGTDSKLTDKKTFKRNSKKKRVGRKPKNPNAKRPMQKDSISIEEDSSLADVSLIESQQEDPTSEKESRTQESCVDDIVSEDKSDTILYIDGEKHAIESEKEPGLTSKLKRTLRNFRYRKSPGGQQTIRKVKDHYRNKDHAKELNKKDVLKYQSGSHGHDVLSEYLSSPSGRSSLKEAASRYQSSLAGKSSLKEAVRRYESSLAGKSSRKEASSRYQSSLAGKSSLKKAASRYQSSLAGKSSLKKAASRYESSLAGKSSRNEASSRYQSSLAGKSSLKEASSKYRSAPEFKKKRKDYEDSEKEKMSQSRRTRYRRNRLFEEFEEEFEDDIDYCLTRKDAMKQIRKHTTRNGKKLQFLLHKERIMGFRKSVFLPNISYISRKGTFRTKTFMRSKSKLMWKNAVNRVMIENLNDRLANDIINEWYPSLNFKRNNQYKKKFIASQLQRRILNSRDLWIKVLYGRCHKLNLTSEQLINEEKLDISEEKRFDSILGYKCHRKGVEPRFPLYSFSNGGAIQVSV